MLPPPEVPQNMTRRSVTLGLTNEQEDQLVAFLKTLTTDIRSHRLSAKGSLRFS